MSYILDALRKSEAERSEGRAQTLLATPAGADARRRGVTVALAAILLLNAAALAYWFTPGESATPAAPPPAPLTSGAMTPPEPATAPPQATVPPEADVAPRPLPILAMNALTAAQRATLPPLDISTHIYADDPALRAVYIGGQRTLEGDALARGYVLERITEDGIVVRGNGMRVEIPVLAGWRP